MGFPVPSSRSASHAPQCTLVCPRRWVCRPPSEPPGAQPCAPPPPTPGVTTPATACHLSVLSTSAGAPSSRMGDGGDDRPCARGVPGDPIAPALRRGRCPPSGEALDTGRPRSRAWIGAAHVGAAPGGTDAQRPARGRARRAGRPAAPVGSNLASHSCNSVGEGGVCCECAWAAAAVRRSIRSGARPLRPRRCQPPGPRRRALSTGARGGRRCHISARAGVCGTRRRGGKGGWRGHPRPGCVRGARGGRAGGTAAAAGERGCSAAPSRY